MESSGLQLATLIAILVQAVTITWWARGIDVMVKDHDKLLQGLAGMASGTMESPAARVVHGRINGIEERVERLEEDCAD